MADKDKKHSVRKMTSTEFLFRNINMSKMTIKVDSCINKLTTTTTT